MTVQYFEVGRENDQVYLRATLRYVPLIGLVKMEDY